MGPRLSFIQVQQTKPICTTLFTNRGYISGEIKCALHSDAFFEMNMETLA